jgi:hypothetical protein
MSIKLTNHLEGNYYQHKEFVLEQLASATGVPSVQGILYANTTDKGFYYHDGTNWKRIDNQSMTASAILSALLGVDGAGSGLDADKLDNQEGTYYLSRANHSGTQLATSISDLATTVKGYRLDEFAIPTANVNLNSQKITNLAAPTSSTSNDAVSATWVTNAISNYVNQLDPKGSVYVAVSSPINLATVGSNVTIDGQFIPSGVRVLVKGQTTASENGIYDSAPGQWTRSADATITGTQTLTNGSYTIVEGGTDAGTGWLYNAATYLWTKYTEQTVISAGTGVSVSTVGGTSTVSINTDVVARKYSVSIGDGTNTTFTVTHGLATEDVYVSVREAVGFKEFVLADIAVTGTGTISVTFGDIPTSNQYRVTVIG